jgi:hypothetical protein
MLWFCIKWLGNIECIFLSVKFGETFPSRKMWTLKFTQCPRHSMYSYRGDAASGRLCPRDNMPSWINVKHFPGTKIGMDQHGCNGRNRNTETLHPKQFSHFAAILFRDLLVLNITTQQIVTKYSTKRTDSSQKNFITLLLTMDPVMLPFFSWINI